MIILDFYAAAGVVKGEEKDVGELKKQIEQARKRLAFIFHPDKFDTFKKYFISGILPENISAPKKKLFKAILPLFTAELLKNTNTSMSLTYGTDEKNDLESEQPINLSDDQFNAIRTLFIKLGQDLIDNEQLAHAFEIDGHKPSITVFDWSSMFDKGSVVQGLLKYERVIFPVEWRTLPGNTMQVPVDPHEESLPTLSFPVKASFLTGDDPVSFTFETGSAAERMKNDLSHFWPRISLKVQSNVLSITHEDVSYLLQHLYWSSRYPTEKAQLAAETIAGEMYQQSGPNVAKCKDAWQIISNAHFEAGRFRDDIRRQLVKICKGTEEYDRLKKQVRHSFCFRGYSFPRRDLDDCPEVSADRLERPESANFTSSDYPASFTFKTPQAAKSMQATLPHFNGKVEDNVLYLSSDDCRNNLVGLLLKECGGLPTETAQRAAEYIAYRAKNPAQYYQTCFTFFSVSRETRLRKAWEILKHECDEYSSSADGNNNKLQSDDKTTTHYRQINPWFSCLHVGR